MNKRMEKIVFVGFICLLGVILTGAIFDTLMDPASIVHWYKWCISAGRVDRMEVVRIRAVNPATSDSYSCIWSLDEAYNRLDATTYVKVASSSNADTNKTGDSAWSILIEGLDGTYQARSERVYLAGQTSVTVKNPYLRINSAKVDSGEINAGDIYVFDGAQTSGVPDDATKIYAKIDVGARQTRQGFYTVPEGENIYVNQILFHRPDTFSDDFFVTYRMRHTDVDEPSASEDFFIDFERTIYGDGGNEEHHFDLPLKVTEHNDIWFEAKSSSATVKAELEAEMVLVEE